MTSNKRIARMEKWLSKLYAEAEKDMRVKWDEHLARQEKRAERLLSRVREAKTPEAKATAEAKYREFLKNRVFAEKYYKDMVAELARQYADAGRRAAEIVNGERFGAFADGYNFSAGEINRAAIDKDIGIRFDLCDAGTIEHLAEHAEDLLLPPKADPSKVDLTVWNVHNINSQVTQGIVQGESIPKIAARLGNVTHMNEVAAVRTARTMTTACENAGRVQSMQMAENWGVQTWKRWMCTLDSRTRDSHLALDGETVDNDAAFSNKCRYPGDPNGPPAEVYNCRCTLNTVVDGFSSNLPKGKQGAVHISIDGEELERGKDYMIRPKYEQEGLARKMLEERLKKREERQKKRKERQKENQVAAEQLTGWDKVRALRTAKPASEMSSAELKEIGRAFYDADEYKEQVQQILVEHNARIAELERKMREVQKAYQDANEADFQRIVEGASEEEQIQMGRRQGKLWKQYEKARDELFSAQDTVAQKEAVSRLVAEVREEGRGISSEAQRKAHLGTVTEARKAVVDGYSRYPESWVKASTDRSSLTVKKVSRGYYWNYKNELMISGDGVDAKNTAVHEIGHRMEHIKGLLDAERRFYAERTSGEESKCLGAGYARTEVTKKDDFVHPYIGKDYGGGAFELVSMGMEGIIGFTNQVDLSKDEDMRDWITGILLAY